MPDRDSDPTTPNDWFANVMAEFLNLCADEGIAPPFFVLVVDAEGGGGLFEYELSESGTLAPEFLWERATAEVKPPVTVIAVDRHGKSARALLDNVRPH